MNQKATIYTIGRIPNCDFHFDNQSVSRCHAEIFVDPEKNVFLSDLNSTNGTYVNGIKICEPVLLRRGDKLEIGNKILVDWESFIFGKIEPDVSPPNSPEPENENSPKNQSFFEENKELIVIYGIVVFLFLVLNMLT